MFKQKSYCILFILIFTLAGCKIEGNITHDGTALESIPVVLSGNASMTTTTDQNGYYSFEVPNKNGTYLVTPTSSEYVFTPESIVVNIDENTPLGGVSNVNFTSDKIPVFIGFDIQYIEAIGDTSSTLNLNDNGDIVTGNLIWHSGQLTDLGDLGGGITYAEAINNDMQVVGTSKNSNNRMVAFLWEDNIMYPLTSLGGESGSATDINNLGEIVGYTDNIAIPSILNHRATFWTSSLEPIDLGAWGDDSSSRAYAINDNGFSAGISLPSTSSGYGGDAVYWENETIESFVNDIDPSEITIKDLNNNDQIVGSYMSQAYVFKSGDGMVEIGVPGESFSIASGINDKGQIVGWFRNSDAQLRAFYYESDNFQVLSDMVLNMEGWDYLSLAYKINNNGQIVGKGKRTSGYSNNSVFLLTPVYQ